MDKRSYPWRNVRLAIEDQGKEKVARVGLSLEGPVDIETFKEKVYR